MSIIASPIFGGGGGGGPVIDYTPSVLGGVRLTGVISTPTVLPMPSDIIEYDCLVVMAGNHTNATINWGSGFSTDNYGDAGWPALLGVVRAQIYDTPFPSVTVTASTDPEFWIQAFRLRRAEGPPFPYSAPGWSTVPWQRGAKQQTTSLNFPITGNFGTSSTFRSPRYYVLVVGYRTVFVRAAGGFPAQLSTGMVNEGISLSHNYEPPLFDYDGDAINDCAYSILGWRGDDLSTPNLWLSGENFFFAEQGDGFGDQNGYIATQILRFKYDQDL